MEDKTRKKKILLVEDDKKLAGLVRDYLQTAHGFLVDVEEDGAPAPARILAEQPDLVILDILLPGKDGLTICREIRDAYKGPILMFTAHDAEVDEIVGLEVGADDYVAKPVSPRLLAARVKALLRRTERRPSAGKEEQFTPIEHGPLIVDPGKRTAWLETTELDLTTAEFDLLLLLSENAGEVVTREKLYRELRGIEWDGIDRSIDLRVARLRKKLSDVSENSDLIKSVRGLGYLLVASP